MPLSNAQLDVILSTIDGIFSLPEDAKELPREITKIKNAFLNDQIPVEDYRFIQKPAEYFLRLEDVGPPIKIGEVKKQLLKHTTEIINIISERINFPISKELWNHEAILNHINESKDADVLFKTVRSIPDNIEPLYPINSNEDQIYKARVDINEDRTQTLIYLSVYLTDNEVITSTHNYIEVPELNFENEQERLRAEEQYLQHIAMESYLIAQEEAASHVMKYLIREKIITRNEANTANTYAGNILTYKTYLDLLRTEKMTFSEISRLSKTQADALVSPVILKLIREKRSTINRLKDIKANEIAILNEPYLLKLIENGKYELEIVLQLSHNQKALVCDPYYAPMVFEGRIPLLDILKLTNIECRQLILPASINLHRHNKITFNQICKMDKGTRSLIADPHYAKLIFDNKITYNQIEDVDEQTGILLTSPRIIVLLANNIITIEQAKNLSSKIIKIISEDPIIFYLLSEKILSFENVEYIKAEEPRTFWPKANYAIKPLSAELKGMLPPLIKEFIQLSIFGLLYDTDLHYLYEHLGELSKEMKDYKYIDEKKSHARSMILNNKSMLKRAETNIKNQIQNILLNTQTTKSEDYKKIMLNCEGHNIKFKDLRKKAFQDTLILSYSDQATYPFHKVITQGSKVGLSNEEIIHLTFGKRMISIFNQDPFHINNVTDTIQNLISDISTANRILNIDLISIYNIIFTILIEEIKQQLEDMKMCTNNIIYSDLLKILNTYDNEIKKHSDPTLKFQHLKKTLKSIIETTSIQRMPEQLNINKAHSLRFFAPKLTLSPLEDIALFCQKLVAISHLLNLLGLMNTASLSVVRPY